MKFKKLTLIFISIIVISFALIAGLEWWNTNKSIVSTDNAYVRASITTIASRVSSYVQEVPALTNSIVKKHDLLAILDSEPYENKVDALKASVEAAKANIEAAKARILTTNSSFNNIDAKMQLVKSEIKIFNSNAKALSSELQLSNQNLKIIEKLFENKSVSKAKLEEANAKVQTTSHELDSAKAKTTSIKYKLEVLSTEKEKIDSLKSELTAYLKKSEADLHKSEAELKMANVDLKSTNIYAPIDGVIANRIAEPGIYVEDGWPLMAIVPIHDIWIIANYKETQVENIKVGQKVKLHFDAFPNNTIIGNVHSIAPASSASFSLLPPQNASGNFVKVVQRVPVKITFKTPKNMVGRIVPGLSVYVSIETKK
jgi:membrane fusion protein (multidrug efflux system)